MFDIQDLAYADRAAMTGPRRRSAAMRTAAAVATVWAMVIGFGGCSERNQPAGNAPIPAADVAPPASNAERPPPNILLIVADDLGYSDLGAYGAEIDTPNLDALAREGLQLTNFHVAPTCSPTRSMLFSGTDNHLAGLGGMLEVLRSTHPERIGQPGYETYLNFRVASLANLLRDAGYHTYMAGKWHLGLEEETSPAARGFERSFALIDGAGSHFTDMGVEVLQPKARYREDGRLVPLPENFYSTRTYTDKLLAYLSGDGAEGAPFFAYLAFTAPHWPLEAPAESVAKYAGKYDDGYDVLLERRLARMQALGLIDDDVPVQPRLPGEPAWTKLTEEERRIEARKMELYAAMVDDLDKNVGRVVDYLKAAGELDNTFIFFMSDNGPEGGRLELRPEFRDFMKQCCDNSYENLGRPGSNSYVYYGPNWARVGAGPFRGEKGLPAEGGIRVPAFARYPGFATGRSDALITVMDLLPTFLALAGTEHPGTTYRGRTVLPVKGKSLLPLLQGERVAIHPEEHVVGWELHGHSALRQGNWKLLRMRPPRGSGDWQLYDLAHDAGEHSDLSSAYPARRAQLLGHWTPYAAEGNIVLPDWDAD